MNDEYTQGFIDKCAEAGVDPESLVKRAGRGDMVRKLLHNTKRLPGDISYTRDSLSSVLSSNPDIFRTKIMNSGPSGWSPANRLLSHLKTLRWKADRARMSLSSKPPGHLGPWRPTLTTGPNIWGTKPRPRKRMIPRTGVGEGSNVIDYNGKQRIVTNSVLANMKKTLADYTAKGKPPPFGLRE